MTAVPVETLRALAIEWRREADRIDDGFPSNTLHDEAHTHRFRAAEIDDVCDYYEKLGASV